MDTKQRRTQILSDLKKSQVPLNATFLANTYGVSRQVVVGDIAILKAQQEPIVASVKGYVYIQEEQGNQYTIACKHREAETQDELQIIVDYGGVVLNVIVDHPLYGELIGKLDIRSRYDVDQFIMQAKQTKARNLSEMNDGIHLHTIQCDTTQIYERIKKALKEKGYLYE